MNIFIYPEKNKIKIEIKDFTKKVVLKKVF